MHICVGLSAVFVKYHGLQCEISNCFWFLLNTFDRCQIFTRSYVKVMKNLMTFEPKKITEGKTTRVNAPRMNNLIITKAAKNNNVNWTHERVVMKPICDGPYMLTCRMILPFPRCNGWTREFGVLEVDVYRKPNLQVRRDWVTHFYDMKHKIMAAYHLLNKMRGFTIRVILSYDTNKVFLISKIAEVAFK